MALPNGKQNKERTLTIRKIKWATIIILVALLASMDWVRQSVFFAAAHSLAGFIATYVVLGIGITVFSFAVFGLIEELQRAANERNRYLQGLNEIAKVSATNPNLKGVLQVGLDTALSIMKADCGLICLVDLEREEHSVVCHRNIPEEIVRKLQRAKIKDDALAPDVIRTSKPVIVERPHEDPRVAEAARRLGIKFIVSAPLKFETEVKGILAVGSYQEHRFSDIDRDFFEGISGQLGMAITNTTLYEQTQLQNRELNALLSVGKAATSSFNLDNLLIRSLDTVSEVTATDAAEIWLMESDEVLVMRCHRGTCAEAFLEQTCFHVGDGIPGIVAQEKKAILVNDLSSDNRFKRQKVVDAGFHTFYAIPLLYYDKVLGVLCLATLTSDCLDGQRKLGLVKGIGEWLSLAIENTRLYQQIQDVAVMSERERIAHEMHDGMAQLLGYINTQTIAVKKLLSDKRLVEAHEELARMGEVTRSLYTDVREGILGLRIAAHQSDGLISALKEYVERYTQMSGVQVEVRVCNGAGDSLISPSAEIQLMRIIQEALTNVRKHSKANGASVTFQRVDKGLIVTIADDGRGFEPRHLPTTGWPRFGLQTMRERADAIGGELILDSTPGKGTRIEVLLPLRPTSGMALEHESVSG